MRSALVDGVLVAGDVEITGEVISAVALPPAAADLLAVPGFVDLQVNGYDGIDFLACDVAGHRHAAAAMARSGVTAYQPTLVTSAPAMTIAALSTLSAARRDPVREGARPLPAHLEGPFISPSRRGAHDARHIAGASVAAAEALCDAGPVGMMTIAPELDGALEVITALRRRGVVASLGHSDATADDAAVAFEAGATAVTHIFNAMRPIRARDPGLAGAALTRPTVTIMAIVDGVHLDRETVRLLVAAARPRLCLVTDAIGATGRGNGDFVFGGQVVHVSGATARLADGTLAGSVLTMDAAVRNLMAHGMSTQAAVAAATRVPASLLGDEDIGVLRVGGRADVTVLDGAFEVQRTVIGGVEVYAR